MGLTKNESNTAVAPSGRNIFPGHRIGSKRRRGERPKLLVSVRDADEAEIAIEAGAEWIDIKEPRRGPLGCADIETIQHVAHAVDGRTPVSAALGELYDITPSLASRIASIPDVCLVKIGLAGTAADPGYTTRWFSILDAVEAFAAVAAVAYADWQVARAPRPDVVIRTAATRCQALLLDTFDKNGPALPELLTPEQINGLLTVAWDRGMATVVAGRLTMASMADVLSATPDYIAIRGAGCHESRTGTLSAKRIRELREWLATRHSQSFA